MDPGNLDTDIQAGARFQYRLIWVLILASFLGLLVQTLATRLGVITGKNLAQLCRREYPKKLSFALWILAELTVIASDIPEVIGTAIALRLLFKIQLWVGVIITAFSVFLFLGLSYFGVRKLEFFIASLVGMILVCFLAEMFISHVPVTGVLSGLTPTASLEMVFSITSLTGAVVMPHNLFLHSGLVQTRAFGRTASDIKEACKYNLIESAIALSISIIINISVISVSAKDFFYNEDAGLETAPKLLNTVLGGDRTAEIFFALALLASGQSSTMTGTFAGQYVMEGFLDLNVPQWLRASITRGMAILPSLAVALAAGEGGADNLIVLSQTLLSILLPFSLIPLLKFTNSETKMGRKFANPKWVKIATMILSAMVITANLALVFSSLEDAVGEMNQSSAILTRIAAVLFGLSYIVFLVYLVRKPLTSESFASVLLEDEVEIGPEDNQKIVGDKE